MLGTTEILMLAGIVVLLFGAAAIPKLARSIGQARKAFRDGLDDSSSDPDGE
ncbi:MAG: twin-arginine translocase TatA/TatE family subunit [Lentisphaeria bacterium]|jgi:sec-independent protein translocase protein TatA|nr:twin-arginine translocase TatA/TatE family subunit [Lentisphaeria bacterium]